MHASVASYGKSLPFFFALMKSRIVDEIVTVLDFSVRPSDVATKYADEILGTEILADQEWLDSTRFKEVVIARSLPGKCTKEGT